jgi:hypothetical protein
MEMHGPTEPKSTVGYFCGVRPLVTYRPNTDIRTAVNNRVSLVLSQHATCFGLVDYTLALKYTTLKPKIRLQVCFGF